MRLSMGDPSWVVPRRSQGDRFPRRRLLPAWRKLGLRDGPYREGLGGQGQVLSSKGNEDRRHEEGAEPEEEEDDGDHRDEESVVRERSARRDRRSRREGSSRGSKEGRSPGARRNSRGPIQIEWAATHSIGEPLAIDTTTLNRPAASSSRDIRRTGPRHPINLGGPTVASAAYAGGNRVVC
jgi:hypothetical protein